MVPQLFAAEGNQSYPDFWAITDNPRYWSNEPSCNLIKEHGRRFCVVPHPPSCPCTHDVQIAEAHYEGHGPVI
jgi:hypothetical protein